MSAAGMKVGSVFWEKFVTEGEGNVFISLGPK